VPVHAAGIYKSSHRDCCADYAVSSYTPTVAALLRAQQGVQAYGIDQVKLLLIAAEHAQESAPALHYVPQEIKSISTVAEQAHACAVFAEGSAHAVASLPAANMAHFACHGTQDASEPHKSRFCLSDGSLSVSELMEVDLKDAFFAFLSACETAKGDTKHADEVVHLAASMLFAGFRSIVATMW
jgi:CHAT domain-containing protein